MMQIISPKISRIALQFWSVDNIVTVTSGSLFTVEIES